MYPCVINETDGSTTTLLCNIDQSLILLPGDQFGILSQTVCDGHLDLLLTEPPEALINLLIGEVQDLIDANVLDQGGNGLLAILDTVLSGVQNDRPSAVAQLNAFIRAVEGFISGGLLTPGEGQPLIGTAQVAIDQLNR